MGAPGSWLNAGTSWFLLGTTSLDRQDSQSEVAKMLFLARVHAYLRLTHARLGSLDALVVYDCGDFGIFSGSARPWTPVCSPVADDGGGTQ